MEKFLLILTKVERFFASLLILVLTILVIVDVGARELAQTGIPWAQKSAVYMMIWAGFIGAILVTQKVEHLRPEMADKFWKDSYKKIYLRIHNAMVFIFCITMAWYSFKYVGESKEFGDENIILNMPMWILQMVIPYSFFSMSFRYLFFIICPHEKNPKAIH